MRCLRFGLLAVGFEDAEVDGARLDASSLESRSISEGLQLLIGDGHIMRGPVSTRIKYRSVFDTPQIWSLMALRAADSRPLF